MKQEIFINSTPRKPHRGHRDGQLAEFLIERKEEMGIAGNIYKGKVARFCRGCRPLSSTSAWRRRFLRLGF
jgi:Ribonuclease G/E